MGKTTLPCRQPGFWPEKNNDSQPFQRTGWASNLAFWGRTLTHRYRTWARFAELVNQRESPYSALTAAALRTQATLLRQRLYQGGYQGQQGREIVADVFALVREQAARILNQRPFDVQVIGGWVMLNGRVAEMATGEGKTLTATMPASFAALAGIPVHIITANDYLARRDADLMRPLYEALGMRVGVIQEGMTAATRRAMYQRDIVYCSNKEIVFDYLKDRLLFAKQPPGAVNLPLRRLCGQSGFEGSLRLRGLHYAIVDEADSIFIDEARTPLVLSRTGDCGLPPDLYPTLLGWAAQMRQNLDFTLNQTTRSALLTPRGKGTVKDLPTRDPSLLPYRRTLNFLIQRALTALHLFANGREYIVADGQIAIIGEQTGRIMPGRSWEMGLQQFIESKEGCPLTGQPETLTKINYQKFFNKYLYLAGMTGTAREVQRELWDVYRLQVVPVPTNVPPQRRNLGCRLFRTAEEKNRALVERVHTLLSDQRPVLIGTASVSSSETVARLLRDAGLGCTLLNARQDQQEAEIIARAGSAGQITVATNMAGRGTDIVLAPGVAERGGLHVIATECANPRRIDRQLFGRCGRQSDPGSFEALFCLEDRLFQGDNLTAGAQLLRFCLQHLSTANRQLANLLIARVQRKFDQQQYALRRQLLAQDTFRERSLSFNRYGE
jgi:preprotein translocase subunit SecA